MQFNSLKTSSLISKIGKRPNIREKMFITNQGNANQSYNVEKVENGETLDKGYKFSARWKNRFQRSIAQHGKIINYNVYFLIPKKVDFNVHHHKNDKYVR